MPIDDKKERIDALCAKIDGLYNHLYEIESQARLVRDGLGHLKLDVIRTVYKGD